jgi:hypothetical protein
MAENTKGQQNRNENQGQNIEKDKNRKQNASQKNESKQGSGRNFNSPGSGGDREQQTGLDKGSQNASPNRGVSTDMDNDAQTGTEKGNRSETGSGTTTKRNVTGSDLDGTVSY